MKKFKDVIHDNQKLKYVTANLEINPNYEILPRIEKLKLHEEFSDR
jgi:hypothetical protein